MTVASRKELKYLYEERAAINEYCNGLIKNQAEKEAKKDIIRIYLDNYKNFK
jgi:hypothetical protein